MGGGTPQGPAASQRQPGLSPRGRGNLFALLKAQVIRGSIPAWAGEPKREAGYNILYKVYPRVGGGTA